MRASALFWLLLLSGLSGFLPSGSSASSAASARMPLQRKLDWLSENGARRHPDETPTTLTQSEVNEYLAQQRATLPSGVQSLQLSASPGTIQAAAVIDFDRITATQNSNPLLGMFHGTHQIEASAEAYGFDGVGNVHIQWVKVDGVQVPTPILSLFVSRFVTPKYPNVGIDSRFSLPDRISQATVGDRQVTLVQE